MPESVHGHEVMEMMIQGGGSWTRESLEKAIHEKFGAGARFHTCSAENMTARDLIEFLAERGKFSGGEDGFATDPSKICNHE